MSTKLSDIEAMSLAIQLAKQGAGRVSPNPLVGCVVLSQEGTLIGSGYHEYFGGPHAEVNALKNLAVESLKGARVFVTLEPCAHFGKTPPCANMLAELPLAEVIYGLVDPNPLVAGKGAGIIQAAGVKATLFTELKNELEELCEVFLLNQRSKQVFVSLKVATSLDAMMALKTGESKWITNELSREQAHFLRATHDGILVGAQTILLDNPSLNIRHKNFSDKANKVIVLDPHGKVLNSLGSLNIFKTHTKNEVFIFVAESCFESDLVKSLQQQNYQIFCCDCLTQKNLATSNLDKLVNLDSSSAGQVNFNLTTILTKLWELGLRSILVEGGAFTLSEFLRQKMAHRLYQFMAPALIGGEAGLTWTKYLSVQNLQSKILIDRPRVLELQEDILVSGRIEFREGVTNMQTETVFAQNRRSLKFYRSPNGWVFGVCEGLGESFDLSPGLLRLAWLLSFFWYGIGIGIYLALAISLPRKDKFEKNLKRQLLGVCAILSEKSNLEIGIVRFLAILLALTSAGFAVIVYVILYFAFENKIDERTDKS